MFDSIRLKADTAVGSGSGRLIGRSTPEVVLGLAIHPFESGDLLSKPIDKAVLLGSQVLMDPRQLTDLNNQWIVYVHLSESTAIGR